jgi:hypothetical protein
VFALLKGTAIFYCNDFLGDTIFSLCFALKTIQFGLGLSASGRFTSRRLAAPSERLHFAKRSFQTTLN